MPIDFEQTFPIYDLPNAIEPVLRELMASAPMQRLKRIHQLGAAHFFRPEWNTKRFEHSVGVMLFLRRHGAFLEEQIAGLLHDVSHLAFSHVMDFVFPNHEEDFAASLMNEVVSEGEIAAILRRHGFDPRKILDVHAFPLLEQPRPDVCADRFDYAVRDALTFGLITIEQAHRFHDAIAVVDGTFCFLDEAVAKAFAEMFLLNDYIYASPRYICMYFMLAEAIKNALDEGEMTKADLRADDTVLTEKLLACQTPRVIEIMKIIRNGFSVKVDETFPEYVSTKKIRFMDPFVQTSNGLVRLSVLNQDFREELAEHISDRSVPLHLRVVPI